MNNKYTDRLISEWKTHGKIVIGLDFDSTIFPWETVDNEDDMKLVISAVRRAQTIGCYIVMHTCSDLSRHDFIMEYCKALGIEVHSINENPIELPFGGHGKPYCNIYLDDRAGLLEAVQILTDASNHIAGELQQKSIMSQQF